MPYFSYVGITPCVEEKDVRIVYISYLTLLFLKWNYLYEHFKKNYTRKKWFIIRIDSNVKGEKQTQTLLDVHLVQPFLSHLLIPLRRKTDLCMKSQGYYGRSHATFAWNTDVHTFMLTAHWSSSKYNIKSAPNILL